MSAGKDHLASFNTSNTDADMSSVGFEHYARVSDKYTICKFKNDNYTNYLEARGKLSEYCFFNGRFGRGHTCNSTPVCDNYDFNKECGFRCETPAFGAAMDADTWTRQSAQDLLDQHWRASGRPFFLQAPGRTDSNRFLLLPTVRSLNRTQINH